MVNTSASQAAAHLDAVLPVGGGIGTDHRHLKSARHFMEWIYKAEAHLDNKGDTAIKKCCEALQKSLLSIHTLLNQVLPTK